MNAAAAVQNSVPRRIAPGYAMEFYVDLERVAPLPFVEVTLARTELERGDLASARRYALRLPPGSARDEWLGRIALTRGAREVARSYFLAAPDVPWLDAESTRIARYDPAAAYEFESKVRDRLAGLRMHPDAVAESDWLMGVFAIAAARRLPCGEGRHRAWLLQGVASEAAAVRLSPFSVKYLLSLGDAERELGDVGAARRWYARARSVDPADAAAAGALRSLSRH